jgi:uncharacterized protein YceK
LTPYGGVSYDTSQIKALADLRAQNKQYAFDRLQMIGHACDVPLSAVADTLLLPVTSLNAAGRASALADQAPPGTLPTFKAQEPKGP